MSNSKQKTNNDACSFIEWCRDNNIASVKIPIGGDILNVRDGWYEEKTDKIYFSTNDLYKEYEKRKK